MGIDSARIASLNFSLKCRSQNVVDGRQPFEKAGLQVSFHNFRKLLGDSIAIHCEGSTDWRSPHAVVQVPEEAREMVIHIGLNGATGRLLIDDVKLEPEPGLSVIFFPGPKEKPGAADAAPGLLFKSCDGLPMPAASSVAPAPAAVDTDSRIDVPARSHIHRRRCIDRGRCIRRGRINRRSRVIRGRRRINGGGRHEWHSDADIHADTSLSRRRQQSNSQQTCESNYVLHGSLTPSWQNSRSPAISYVTLAMPRKNFRDNGRQTASRSDGLSDGEKWEELTDGFNLEGGAKRGIQPLRPPISWAICNSFAGEHSCQAGLGEHAESRMPALLRLAGDVAALSLPRARFSPRTESGKRGPRVTEGSTAHRSGSSFIHPTSSFILRTRL